MRLRVPPGLFVLVMACACAGGLGGPVTPVDRAARAGDEARVMELERSYWSAEQRHDTATVERLLAPDYVSMSSRGRGDRSKAEELALLFGGRIHLESFQFSNMRAAWIARDALALHYLVDQRFTLDGRALCPHSGSMTVWVRRAGQWLRVARTEYAIGTASPPDCGSSLP